MMASKRTSHDAGNHDMVCQVSKRRHGDSEQQEETSTAAVSNQSAEPWKNEIVSLVRQAVRAELPPILERYLSRCFGLSPNRQSGTFGSRPLQLCFTNKLPPTIFTFSKNIAEDGAPLRIELRDATTQHRIVNEEGSSMKIKLCVLDADFGSNGSENWTAKEFNASILPPREEKGPLLIGDTVIKLKNGVGDITNKIEISDNSSRTRTGKFRLGVKTFTDADIREGISEPFKVLDKRGEGYKKHEVPSLNDEVWRLKKIGKNSETRKKLDSNEIKTVKDFLRLYITNQASLKEIIGKVARKSWDTMIEHAKACKIDDDERYIYHLFIAEKSISLVFNCIYEVVEVSFNGQNYCSLEKLNLEEKRLVERVKQQVYSNVKDLIPLETTTQTLLAGVHAVQHVAADQALRQFDLPIAQQGQPQTWPNLCEPTSHNDQLDFDQLPQDWSAVGQLISAGAYNDGNELTFSGSHIDQPASYFSLPNGDGAECSNHFCFPNSTVYISSKGKRKTVWHKIRYALKWAKLHVLKRKAKAQFPVRIWDEDFLS